MWRVDEGTEDLLSVGEALALGKIDGNEEVTPSRSGSIGRRILELWIYPNH